MVLAKLGNKRAPREVLSAARTYYVRTDGSDSNNGLADTVGGAFLTIQKAIDVAASLDSSIYDVTIRIANGTYNVTNIGLIAKQMVGAGKIIILGDESNPANVIITSTGVMTAADALFSSKSISTRYAIRGLRLNSTATGVIFGISASSGSYVEFQNIDFGTGITHQQIRVEDNAVVFASGNYSISGGSIYHVVAVGGAIFRAQSRTLTLTGTPAFTVFCNVSRSAVMFMNVLTLVGSATGVRYEVFDNGTVFTDSETSLPGNAAGSRYSSGVFNGQIGGSRELLTANRTYYVRSDGNDNNTGLVDSSVGAFLTVQKAIDVVTSLDLSIYTVLIQLGDGTWSTPIAVNSRWAGGGSNTPVTIRGNSTTPGNVKIVVTGANENAISATGVGRNLRIEYMDISSTHSGGIGILSQNGAYISVGPGIRFDTCGLGHTRANGMRATIDFSGTSYAIIGDTGRHFWASPDGYINAFGSTATFSGTRGISIFAVADRQGFINAQSMNFAGTFASTVGQRFSGQTNAVIWTGNSGLNFFPGNSDGTLSGGALYDSLIGGVRENLSANRTYYIRTDGSDANTGLANTSGGAFATVQKALDTVGSLDFGIYTVTIQIGDGTYSNSGTNLVKPWAGSGNLIIQGNTSNKNSVIINKTSGNCFDTSSNLTGTLTIQYMKLQTTTSGDGIRHTNAGTVLFNNINFGACAGNHIAAQNTGYIVCNGNYFISGNANVHASGVLGGKIFIGSRTITFEANATFSVFAYADRQAAVYADAMTFTLSGFTVTGQRYNVGSLAIIHTNGGGANYFPGNTGGSGTNPSASPYGLYT